MPVTTPFEFDDEWASATDWARMYRGLGVQVMPAHNPSDGGQWKRPVMDWLEFRDTLIPDALFARLYDPASGEHRLRKNMGMITGAASGGLFMLDLDVKPGGPATAWWLGLLAVHNNDTDLDTPTQRTGGGGLQVLLRAPDGWAPPTFKTPIGVDVRGQGGFAMLPPSRHASGQGYEWLAGHEPWACDPITAPDWLIEAIEELREAHGGASPGGHERTPAEAPKNAFGLDVDDREHKLLQAVWGAVVDLYRESPIPPPESEQEAERLRLWTQYEATTKSRLTGPQYDGLDNAQRLEREGRGISELRRKWAYAMGRWNTKVREAAALPKPGPGPSPQRDENLNTWRPAETPAGDGDMDEDEPEPPADLRIIGKFEGDPPARRWLVPDWIVQGAVNSLYGAGGTGKSLLALQLTASTALGAPWLGLPVTAGRAMFVSCEDDADEVHRRIWSVKAGMGYAVGWPFADNLLTLDRFGEENRLVVADRHGNPSQGPFADPLERAVIATLPNLLVLDTLADVYAASEIDRGQVNWFLKTMLSGLIVRAREISHSLTILLIGHPSDTGRAEGGKGYSGSGAWEAGVRSRLYLTKPEDSGPDDRLLTRGKANHARAGITTGLRLSYDEGVFRAEAELSDPQRQAIEIAVNAEVRAAWGGRQPLTAKPGHHRNIYTVTPDRLDFDPQATRQAIRRMIEDGQLKVTKRGGLSGLSVNDEDF
jgi:hypothetical protein